MSFSEYMNFTRAQKRSQNVNVNLHRKSSIQNVKVGTCIDRIILRHIHILTYTNTHSKCYSMNGIEMPKHCRFLVPDNTQKILTGIWHYCWLLPSAKNLPRRAELAWEVSRYLWRLPWNFKMIFSRPLFNIILTKNGVKSP